ncbi:hypothetical protein K493DRAFT_295839 [Basidiobolus meristosporus CBS 931.73]|uniref:Uncharacterized protein n=1 Tax=Basidiobolus meristosporus CBS 931.73 TaxID=1314790 RepID=A0A1Y1Z9J6_9FUNG|nr:hypothetical protein K493DRAFT_295839 [Basidiobolus meristosporus CBS 931.73]|eukprot:ORY06697.1 hypothetical protein K493DRAFT_295839 [Basidiobolus meristosporus CBS 931.73]
MVIRVKEAAHQTRLTNPPEYLCPVKCSVWHGGLPNKAAISSLSFTQAVTSCFTPNELEDLKDTKMILTSRTDLKNAILHGRPYTFTYVIASNPPIVLYTLLYDTWMSREGCLKFDRALSTQAETLLGDIVDNMNFLQLACLHNREKIALQMLDFLCKELNSRKSIDLLQHTISHIWGQGNTTLHLASLIGLTNLVKRLLEHDMNPYAKNDLGYSSVDCATLHETKKAFWRFRINQPDQMAMFLEKIV